MPYIPFGQLPAPIRSDNSLNPRFISSGTINAKELIIAGEGFIRSGTYDPTVPAGWAIFGDGSADFAGDVTFRGNATVTGSLFVTGNLQVSGIFRTAAATSSRIEVNTTGGASQFRWYSGTTWVAWIDYSGGQMTLGTVTNQDITISAAGDLILSTAGQNALAGGGTAAAPKLVFSGDLNCGLYHVSADVLAFSTSGAQRMRFGTGTTTNGNDGLVVTNVIETNEFHGDNGAANDPTYTFTSTPTSGMWLQGGPAIADGSLEIAEFINSSGVGILQLANHGTTGSAANAFINSTSGNVSRSTSSLRFKPGWEFADEDFLARLEIPRPITWIDTDGGLMLGFGVEHLEAMDPRVTQDWDEFGAPQNYDVRSLIAILSAKVKRLEKVAGLD